MDQNKPMFEGNWKCAGCGASITKLPFEPSPDRQDTLRCIDCFKQSKQANGQGGGGGGDRQMFEGNWKCSQCGGAINKLPFEPNPERANTLKCIDCFKASRG